MKKTGQSLVRIILVLSLLLVSGLTLTSVGYAETTDETASEGIGGASNTVGITFLEDYEPPVDKPAPKPKPKPIPKPIPPRVSLPQTGSAGSSATTAFGLMMVVSLGGIVFYRKRQGEQLNEKN